LLLLAVLSRCRSEQPAEQSIHVALVIKATCKRNLGDILAGPELLLRRMNSQYVLIGVWRHAHFMTESPDQMEGTASNNLGDLRRCHLLGIVRVKEFAHTLNGAALFARLCTRHSLPLRVPEAKMTDGVEQQAILFKESRRRCSHRVKCDPELPRKFRIVNGGGMKLRCSTGIRLLGEFAHALGSNVEVSIDPAATIAGLTRVCLSRRDEVQRIRPRVIVLAPALETASATIIDADRVTIMEVFRERVTHLVRTHQLESAPMARTEKLSLVLKHCHP
jgi:hypothetical protein